MSILKSMEEKHGVKKGFSGERKQSFNLPVLITGYEDNQFFIGQRLDTKEMVKIKLREDVVAKGANPKPVVADFSDFKNKRYAKPNDAILLFDNSYVGEDGVWVSRWANTLHKTPKMESQVLIMNSSIRFVEDKGQKYVQVRVMKKRAWINSIQELEANLVMALNPKSPSSRPFAYVRLKSSDEEVVTYYVSPKMIEIEVNGQKVKSPALGQESYQEFLTKEHSKVIMECCNLPEVTVEVLYGTSIYFGGDTKDKYFSNAAIRGMLESAYFIDPAKDNSLQNLGFKKTVIAVREMHGTNGLMFVTEAKPLVNNSESIPIDQLNFD